MSGPAATTSNIDVDVDGNGIGLDDSIWGRFPVASARPRSTTPTEMDSESDADVIAGVDIESATLELLTHFNGPTDMDPMGWNIVISDDDEDGKATTQAAFVNDNAMACDGDDGATITEYTMTVMREYSSEIHADMRLCMRSGLQHSVLWELFGDYNVGSLLPVVHRIVDCSRVSYVGIASLASHRWAGMGVRSHRSRFDFMYVLTYASRERLIVLEKGLLATLRSTVNATKLANRSPGGEPIRGENGFLYLCMSV